MADGEAAYLIDLHGLREAFNSTNNQVRVAVIDALESGEMRIMRAASEELKATDEDAYADFQSATKKKKYEKTQIKHEATRASLMSTYGATLFGSSPPSERFEAMAICVCEKYDLVTNGKPHADCKKIVSKCSLNGTKVLTVEEFAKL